MAKAEALIARIGDFESFKRKYCPANIQHVAKDAGRAYNGISPTLEVVGIAYGEDSVTSWLYAFLEDFVLFVNKGRLTSLQITDVARMMAEEKHFKVTEVMLFFRRLKGAEYGRIFGQLDPLFIMDAFKKFLSHRMKDRDEYVTTSTDCINDDPYKGLPTITFREAYDIAIAGECIDPEAAPIIIEEYEKMFGRPTEYKA